jgi:hypothetical protein
MRHIEKFMISAALLAGVAVSTQASAMPITKIYDIYPGNNSAAARTAFMPDQQAILGDAMRLDRLNGQTARSVEAYYDFDTIITLGSLALAGGALAGLIFSAKRREDADAADEQHDPAVGWRDLVMKNLEADLMAFVRNPRRAA